MEAKVPYARIIFQRFETGKQTFTLEFEDGNVCASTTGKDTALTLKCGTKGGYYWLTKVAKNDAKLEWITPIILP
jgi:hypothetical protein